MRTPLLVLLPLLPPLLPLPPAAAQTIEATLPELVVTATRLPTPTDRLPVAVTVIERREIEERGYTTLAEALSAVPGLRLVQAGGVGQQASAFLRGTNSRHVLVLRDGVPINDPAEPGGAFNFGNELLADVERIEIVRGPVSALFGTAAIGGVINLITRRPPPDRSFAPYGEIAGGTARTAQGHVGAGGTIGAADWGVTAQSLSTRGSNALAPRFWTNRGERDGLRAAALTTRFGLTLGETTPLSALGATRFEGLLRWRENTFGLDDIPRDDPNYSGQDRNWFGYLRARTDLAGGGWMSSLTLYGSHDRRRYVNRPDPFSAATADDLYLGERRGVAWDNALRLPLRAGIDSAHLIFGSGWEREQVETAAGSPFFRTTVDAGAEAAYGYLGLQLQLLDRFDLTAALRLDNAADYGSEPSWRFGVGIALPEIASRLHAAAGTAFKAPSLFQRYGRIGTFFRGNPALEAERSSAWEVGMETELGRGLILSALYFENRIRDLINFDPTFSTLVNIDRARLRGAEFGAMGRVAAWLTLSGYWTVTDARDLTADRPLPRRPRHLGGLGAHFTPLWQGQDLPPLRPVIFAELLYFGPSPEGAWARYRDDGTAIPYPGKNAAGWLVNLTATAPLGGGASAFLTLRNLGNSRYEPANGFVVPGRTALVGLRHAF